MSRYANRARFGLRRRQSTPSVIDTQFAPGETKEDVMHDIYRMTQQPSPERDAARPVHKRIDVRYVVKYPMLGDLPGSDWLQLVGDAALQAELIKGYRLLYVAQGAFGLQNVLFLMDANVVVGDYEQIDNVGNMIAAHMVGESDVEILGIELI